MGDGKNLTRQDVIITSLLLKFSPATQHNLCSLILNIIFSFLFEQHASECEC